MSGWCVWTSEQSGVYSCLSPSWRNWVAHLLQFRSVWVSSRVIFCMFKPAIQTSPVGSSWNVNKITHGVCFWEFIIRLRSRCYFSQHKNVINHRKLVWTPSVFTPTQPVSVHLLWIYIYSSHLGLHTSLLPPMEAWLMEPLTTWPWPLIKQQNQQIPADKYFVQQHANIRITSCAVWDQ